jgi:hypothetical protein
MIPARLLQHSGPGGPDRFVAIAQMQYRQASSLVGLLLTPVAVSAGALAAWRFGVDAGWTRTFFIAGGFLSHWQVWCVFAISAEACAYSLSRGVPEQDAGIAALRRVRASS